MNLLQYRCMCPYKQSRETVDLLLENKGFWCVRVIRFLVQPLMELFMTHQINSVNSGHSVSLKSSALMNPLEVRPNCLT